MNYYTPQINLFKTVIEMKKSTKTHEENTPPKHRQLREHRPR